MSKSKQEFKVGDLVRVPGVDSCGTWHAFYAGQVVEVCDVDRDYPGQVGMVGASKRHGSVVDQGLDRSHLKLAKQAMRKRDEYATRR